MQAAAEGKQRGYLQRDFSPSNERSAVDPRS